MVARHINGVVVTRPTVHKDGRGVFVETYRRSWFPGQREMIQANRSDKQANALVGLHYHLHQSDYWYVPHGTVRVVLHDLRQGSDTEGTTIQFNLGAWGDGEHDHSGVYIPPGVAHGFAAISDCTLTYLVDSYYNPADELGVRWNDPEIDADWGVDNPILSERDQNNPLRSELELPHNSLRT